MYAYPPTCRVARQACSGLSKRISAERITTRPITTCTQTATHTQSSAQRSSNKPAWSYSTSSQSILSRMPKTAWDSHMHVTSPDYALASTAAYKPSLHSLEQAMAFESTIGVSNIVLVQPSIYGNDNSCLLDALKAVGPRHGRGVVGIDPATIDVGIMKEWHEMGVRGVRLNLKSTNARFTEESLSDMLLAYAKVVRPMNWVLELFVGMESIEMLERVIKKLEGVRLCIAHFGAPTLPSKNMLDPYGLEGFRSLTNLLQDGNTWVKLSAAYRFDSDPNMRCIATVGKELLRVAGDRAVFASDWPHTRFDGLDVKPFVAQCLRWTEELGVTEKVFCTNAEELWDVA